MVKTIINSFSVYLDDLVIVNNGNNQKEIIKNNFNLSVEYGIEKLQNKDIKQNLELVQSMYFLF